MKSSKVMLDHKTYISNEINANKALTRGLLVSAIIMIICWIGYVSSLFQIAHRLLVVINVVFPIVIVILGGTFFFTRTKIIESPKFKYFLIYLYLLAIFVMNVFLPKHSILLWAAAIVIVNHYYNPKVSIVTCISVFVMMLVALYLAMFFGEWDPCLLNGAEDLVINGKVVNCEDTSLSERIEWLKQLNEAGDNRYLKVFLFYYIPRSLEIGLIATICYQLSIRTSNLLQVESTITKVNEKIENELTVAREIQKSVLPKMFDNNPSCDLYGLMDAAKLIGGDFYDYFYIDETHLAFVIADVSGKGVPSALFMMKTETLIKSLTNTLQGDTAKILERINISLCHNNEQGMFVTCWLGILDLINGELKYCNAGHIQPIVIRNGMVEFLSDKPGIVLGALHTSSYEEKTIKFDRGDRLFLYTDGVVETHNSEKEIFGSDRLFQFTIDNKDRPAREFVYKLRKEITDFQGDAEQFDDITMLMCEYKKEVKITESKTFIADVSELDNLFEYSTALLRILNFKNRDITMINTALEEIFVNVSKYAYEEKGTVIVSLSSDKNKVTFVFKDSGKKFNPLDREDPNINASSEEREIGGLGIYMVKKIMDDVSYEYKDGYNILTLVKNRK